MLNIGRKKLRNKNRKGFGILEVIIAVFILVMGLVSAMSLISKTVTAGSVGASRLIASQLAQEGIEIARNIRDVNYSSSGWDSWYASVSGTNDYIVQYNDASFRSFSDTPLKYDAATGLYGYDSGLTTVFSYKRKITLTKISSVEVKVVSEVTWIEGGRSHSLNVEDRLWNWR